MNVGILNHEGIYMAATKQSTSQEVSTKIKEFILKYGKVVITNTKDIVTYVLEMKNTGKLLSTVVLFWSMWFMYQFAVKNAWSLECLKLLKDGIVNIVQTVTILIGASLGINKALQNLK